MKKIIIVIAIILANMNFISCTPNSVTGNDTPTATDGKNEHVNPGRD